MLRKLRNPPECEATEYQKMDAESLNKTVLDRIVELEQKGLVDHQFRQCYSLKEDNGLEFFVELITVFLDGACQVIKDMTLTANQRAVNFKHMHSHAIKLKGSSACFGACRIRESCSKLCNAIESNSKDGCLQALNDIKHEHKCLEEQLDVIVKLEKEIIRRSSNHKR